MIEKGYAAKWCVHYRNPIKHKTCAAGIKLSEFYKTPFERRPCHLTDKGESHPDAVACSHIRRPTPEEIELHRIWQAKRMERLVVVMTSISSWVKEHRGEYGIIDCPACKGRLHVSVARENGHVHAKCETPGCVSLMQ